MKQFLFLFHLSDIFKLGSIIQRIGTEMSLSRVSIVFHVVLKTLKSRHLDNSRLRNGRYRDHR